MVVLEFSGRKVQATDDAMDDCHRRLEEHSRYIVCHLEDMPAIRDWVWPVRRYS